jgi:hypothetical protein
MKYVETPSSSSVFCGGGVTKKDLDPTYHHSSSSVNSGCGMLDELDHVVVLLFFVWRLLIHPPAIAYV